jgi:hypothetical protein
MVGEESTCSSQCRLASNDNLRRVPASRPCGSAGMGSGGNSHLPATEAATAALISTPRPADDK